MLRKLRRLCRVGPVLFLLLATGLYVTFVTDITDVENMVWTSLGAVINCSSYEKAASRSLQINVGFFSPSPQEDTVNTTSITLVTQLSFDRLGALFHVVDQWSGPVSAAVYLTELELPLLEANISSQPPGLMDKTTLHTVIDDGDAYPINALRNVALNHSATPHVFLTDVDFVPVPGLHEYLSLNIRGDVMRRKDVLVIPAFAYDAQLPIPLFPTNKGKLMKMLGTNVISLCGISYSKRPSQCPTDYDTWYTATAPYEVRYERGYEPYIVMRRSDTPPYDEGFVGREMDKLSHLLEIHAKGYDFVVLPDVFVIHYPHPEVHVTGSNYWCPRIHMLNFENQLRRKYRETFGR